MNQGDGVPKVIVIMLFVTGLVHGHPGHHGTPWDVELQEQGKQTVTSQSFFMRGIHLSRLCVALS